MSVFKFSNLLFVAMAVLAFTSSSNAQLTEYRQDFDDLVPSGDVLELDGWEFFSDNGDATFTLNIGYGGPAPGEGPQISALASDDAGNQFINVYANYDNNALHDDPSKNESVSVFQSQNFTPEEAAAGATWTFNFDFASNPEASLSGTTTTGAFIRVFDSSFNLLDEQALATTSATTEFTSGTLSQTLNPVWEDGGIIQFGFNNRVGRYEGSGIFYDNLSFSDAAATVLGDFDGNGMVDCADLDFFLGNLNVAATGELEQLDLDGDMMVTIDDANMHITTLVSTANGVQGTFPGDLDCDGSVDVLGDAFILVANLGSDVSSYSDGDINLDGTVDVLGDAFALVANLGMSNNPQ